MKFSTFAPFVAALAGLSEAAPEKHLGHPPAPKPIPKKVARGLLDVDLGATVDATVGTVASVAADVSADVSATVDGTAAVSADVNATAFLLAQTYDQATLFTGLAPAAISGDADVNLYIGLPAATIEGTVDVSLGADISVTPTVRIDLGGLSANVEIEIEADAKICETIELFSSLGLDLAVPGLAEVSAGVGLALDLFVCVDAAVDLSAGFAISFPAGSFVEIDILTSTVVDHDLSGLVANILPVSVDVDVDLSVDISIEIGLRLRTEVAISAEVGLLGLDLLGAGAEVAIWINLFDYTAIIIGESTQTSCSSSGLITEAFSLNVGILVDVDVEVLDVLDIEIDLAPTVSVDLAIGATSSACVAISTATNNKYLSTATGTGFTTATGTGSASTATGSASTGSASGSGSGAGYPNGPSNTGASLSYPAATGTGAGYPSGNGSVLTEVVTATPSISTVYQTSMVTITSCAASVVNCPASYTQKVVTAIVYSRTTVCGATMIPSTSATATAGSSVAIVTYPASSLPPASTLTVAPSVESAVIVPTVVMNDKTTVCAGTSVLASTAPSGTYVIQTEAPSASTSKPAVGTGSIIQPSYTAPIYSITNGTLSTGVPPASGYLVPSGYAPPSGLTTSCKQTVSTPAVPATTSATYPVAETTVPGVASSTVSTPKTTTSGYTIVTAGADRAKAQFGAFAAVMAGAIFVL